jgi:HSP20 family protein
MADTTTVPVKVENAQRSGRLARWEPSELFENLEREMARFWPGWRLGPLALGRPAQPLLSTTTSFAPRMDVYEKDGKLMVKADLPGVKKEDIQVTLEGNDLIISGETKSESEVKEENYYRMERTAGSFYRRLPLAFDVKAEQISASFKDGLLELTVPKPAEEKAASQKIAVH